MTLERQVLVWMATGDVGISSQAMAFAAAGITHDIDIDCPQDVGDLRRCLALCEAVPAITGRFAAIAALSPGWAMIIHHWQALKDSLAAEERQADFDGHAPQTYGLMKQLARQAAQGVSPGVTVAPAAELIHAGALRRCQVVVEGHRAVMRVYELEVPAGESDEDVAELIEGGNAPDSAIVEEREGEADPLSLRITAMRDLTAEVARAADAEAAQTAAEERAEREQGSAGPFA